MKKIIELFSPNKRIDKTISLIMLSVQLVLLFVFWIFNTSELIPKPHEIVISGYKLITQENLLSELFTSTFLALQSMLLAVSISLVISYSTVMPFFRPFAFLVSKFRFLTLVGLSLVFVLMTKDGHQLKVSLLVFGVTVFFTTSMISVIKAIPRSEYNYARTLRMKEWEVVWHVIISGKIDMVFELVRQNFAIAWMMLTMVEGISRSEGGIGTLLLNQNKHLHLDAVFAIQIIILLVGIFQDYIFGVLKVFFCPYSNLTLEKR